MTTIIRKMAVFGGRVSGSGGFKNL